MTFTTKGLATRQRIIEGAATYLRTDEPGDATLDDIRAVTRTSKGQIFHYFPGGKEELLLEVARYEADRVLEDQQPHLGRLDSWEAWQSWRDALVARYRAQGARCPLASLMNQVSAVPGAQEVTTTLLHEWQQRVAHGITAMQERGDMRADLDADRMANALVVGIQGGVSMLRVTGDAAHLESVFDVLVDHLRGRGRQHA